MNKNIKDLAKVFQKCKEEGNGLPIIFIGDNINLSKDSSLIQETIKEHKERYNKTESGFKTAIEYIYLTKLFNSEYFDSIYISNFDSLLSEISNLFNAFSINVDEPETLKEQYKQLSNISDYKSILENNKNKPWIFVGYTENDILFKELIKIESFNNEFYWLNSSAHKIISIKLNTNFIEIDSVDNTFKELYSILDSSFSKENIEEKNNKDTFYPLNDFVYENWGTTLYQLAKENNDVELLKDSIDKFEKAISINPKSSYFYNIGLFLFNIAGISKDKTLYFKAIDSFKKAIKIDPKCEKSYNNWGISLSSLAEIENDEKLFIAGLNKFKKAIEIKEASIPYDNWGLSLIFLANLKKDKKIYLEGFKKFRKATDLNPNNSNAYDNWGNAIAQLAELTNDENLYIESLKKIQIAFSLGKNNSHSLAYAYARLEDKENALKFLKICLKKKTCTKKTILEDDIWDLFYNNDEFNKLMDSY